MTKTQSLTRPQRDVLLYVGRFLKEHGIAPTREEMARDLEYNYPSAVQKVVKRLIELCYLETQPGVPRSTSLTKLGQKYVDEHRHVKI